MIEKRTDLPEGLRVEVYYNLHKGQWSVRALEGPDKGRVVARVPYLVLEDVSFVVQPAGRERVRRERRKTVHAFARGRVHGSHGADLGVDHSLVARYNPYQHEGFVYQSLSWRSGTPDRPLAHANGASLNTIGGRPSVTVSTDVLFS